MENFNLKTTIIKLLQSGGFPFDDIRETLDSETNFTIYEIITTDEKTYTAHYKEVLSAINFLVQRIAEEQMPGVKLYFFVDVGGYYQKMINEIKVRAKIMAERAKSFKRDIECDPMPPYERLIVHSYLATYPEVETESKGVGPERRLVIKYAPLKNKSGI